MDFITELMRENKVLTLLICMVVFGALAAYTQPKN